MFYPIEINFSYYLDGELNSVVFKDNFSNKDFRAEFKIDKIGNNEKLVLSIEPYKEIMIENLFICKDFIFTSSDRIFVNGYQSWTDSREFFIDEKLNNISKLAKPLMKRYYFDKYGDYSFRKYSGKKGIFHGYTYSYIRNGKIIDLIGSLSERNGFTIIEENVKNNKILIKKDCNGLWIDKKYTPFEIVWLKGLENEVFDEYFNLMGISKPKLKPMTGWTSWYNYYQNINEDIIIDNLNNFKNLEKKINIFQIDDGYQTAVGDWLSVDKDKFPKGMKYIADAIKVKGYKAGIWLAPFVCETNSEIFKGKKDWILKDSSGEFVVGGSNWSKFYALDIYNQEVRDYIRRVFSVVLEEWGFDMVKLDFLYSVCLVPRRDKTRGQIMTEAMEFLRECAMDKLILGCGVPLGPAFGKVDYCRIGCDVGLDWDDKFYMRLLHRERISTLNAIRNSIGRHHLNGRAFLNDPDVFLLRNNNIKLTETEKETLATVNSVFGSLIFTSDNIRDYDIKKNRTFDDIINLKNRTIEKKEFYRNGLVEVVYTEDKNSYLMLINLSNSTVEYNSKFKGNLIRRDDRYLVNEKIIKIQPHRSIVFIINF
ncbi:alpha-galactosidase [Fervidicella metallireducens AeB]|uniref:Alpha-galactosidase n=1 Tax=Fervidicella metallireducens AeB TaxID=1403537 RepID=A0A017RXX8_9CLOT|nr:glycoside hydrolase family 36 protein [Fervidicella metallireducens]EYE89517.1 alpha-galactosidase [Fervidicella metallireducens AeB]